MGIVCESGENSIFAHRQIPLDMVKTNVAAVDQALLVSSLDIVEQFRRVKVGAIADQRIPDVGPLSLQLAPEQAREIAHDLITTLVSSGYERHKTIQSSAPRPFVGIFILDYRLNPFELAATYRSQDRPEVFRDEVAAERIQEVAGKRGHAHNKRVSASLAELRQQKHGIQMGHVMTLGVELRCSVHGVLKDAEKLWCDLLPAHHGRFDGGSCELSFESFELLQDFGGFHCALHTNSKARCRAALSVQPSLLSLYQPR